MIITNGILLIVIALVSWWLSGFDPRLTGEDRIRDFISRVIRCGSTFFLATIFLALPGAFGTFLEALTIIAIFTLLWCNCLTEMFARGFNRLIDPEDKRAFDPKKNVRDLDTIALLVKNGQKKKAIRLCRELKESGDTSLFAVETLLEHLGVPQKELPKPKPLTAAYLLRSQGKFKKAESILNSLLKKNPDDADAALMLMQIYTQDWHQPDKAAKILQNLKRQPGVLPEQIEFAAHSLKEWEGRKLKLTLSTVPKSIDELLGNGYLGSAIEVLEQRTAAQPENFQSWLKLAEVQAVYCGNLHRADEIIQQIENNSGFGTEQIQTAKTKLQEWRNLAQRAS